MPRIPAFAPSNGSDCEGGVSDDEGEKTEGEGNERERQQESQANDLH